MGNGISDLALAFMLADVADTVTIKLWSPHGVASKTKADGTPVTTADGEAEDAILRAVGAVHPDNVSLMKKSAQNKVEMNADGS